MIIYCRMHAFGFILYSLICFVAQVKVEDWDDRAIKSLNIQSTDNFTTIVNSTVAKTFELYVLYDDLSVNPIAGNADVLRQQARNDGNSLCSITFPVPYGPGWNESVRSGISAVDDDSTCSVTMCLTSQCQAKLDSSKKVILEYHNCDCDIVIENDGNKFSLYTVSYPDAYDAMPNNITLMGIFEKPSNDGVLGGPSEYFGIPINAPVHPSIVPRFKTLQDLADRMGNVLTAVTTIDTTVTIKYSEGVAGEPGSLLFGIAFEGNVQTPPGGISFDSTLQLGDLASVKVQDASFDFIGQISVSNEFGIVFSPDKSESLKLVGVRQNETSCNTTAFNATIIYEKNNSKGNETITITPACDIDGKLGSLVQAFSGNSRLNSDVNVSSIGSSGTFAVAFDPQFSYVQIVVDIGDNSTLKRFGIVNGEFEKKAAFQFASGLFDITAGFELNGGAEITANVADVLEATAVVDASFFGQVQFSAGKQGQLIPFDDWLAKLIDMKDPLSEDYDQDFAVAVLTFDGTITGTVTVDALGISASVAGYLLEPYNYYLLSGNNTGPKFEMDVNLPSFGDLRNLSVGDVINLLQQALELLVGSEEADTVESCSGGLLGVDIFTTKIPVVAVSACDFAGVLKIVVDAVDTLVNECSGCAESSGTSSSDDLTFQALETKLTNLLQGRQ